MDRPKRKIKTLIVDDEPIARRNLRVLLGRDPEVEIVGEAGSGAEAVRLIRTHSPELLFLDIQMPEMNGFEALEQIGDTGVAAIIFVTAFDQYAVRAFEVHALDYLLKPFDDARFEEALRRAKSQIEQREARELSKKLFALLEGHRQVSDESKKADYQSEFMIKSASRVFFLKADEIDWIEAADYYVKLHVSGHSHMLRETMAELEAKLDPQKFARIHRSTIVNLDRVKQIESRAGGDYAVILHDGTDLKMSRSRREQVNMILRRSL
ncbi:MAG TPA: LytTR family DNA-binding domain-containing protein [Blastocatellia bacterium]|nr:LytTR family DNA-binding domain-containing protein [Blastocatellia bacterium]